MKWRPLINRSKSRAFDVARGRNNSSGNAKNAEDEMDGVVEPSVFVRDEPEHVGNGEGQEAHSQVDRT